LLALRRRLIPHSEASVNGAWPASKQFCHFAGEIVDIAGSTLGLLGYGSLGQAVAERARALGLRVIYFSPSRLHKDPQCVSLTELFETSDALSLHCPLTSDTQHIVNADTLRLMQPSSVVINTARGGLIDELALVHALNTGVIAGAGLDVLSQEPPPADHPLLNCHHPQLIITPHVAWASTKTIEKLADEASLNVDAWIKGERRNRVI
jgi:glycerate dehydrogenase